MENRVTAQQSINQRWAHPATDGKSTAWEQRIQHDGKAIETLPWEGPGAAKVSGFGRGGQLEGADKRTDYLPMQIDAKLSAPIWRTS